jgi:predicted nucleic acid-binding protein
LKTFLDSGVLLTGWKGRDRLAAIRLMEDPGREFYTSYLVRLELLPKAIFRRQEAEVEFYRAHLDRVKAEEPLTAELGQEAFDLAKRYGLAAVDALHVAAAIRQGVEEFITSELPGKPLFRVKELTVTSLSSLAIT